jgi:NAD(P)H-nitrite reductase large subunit
MLTTCKSDYFITRLTQLTSCGRDDDTQVCSCHNVTKGDIVENVKNGTCKTIGQIKSCTKAGTGCGGCMPLVQSIFNKTMLEMGQEVSNHCEPLFVIRVSFKF